MPKRYTVRQFAREYGYHPNTVYKMIERGDMPCLKCGGIRIREEDIEEFERRGTFDARTANDDQVVDEPIAVSAAGSSRDAYEKGLVA